jgi:hypothetical protein
LSLDPTVIVHKSRKNPQEIKLTVRGTLKYFRHVLFALTILPLIFACFGGGEGSWDIDASHDVAVEDLDGDGASDIVFGTIETVPISVFLNRGNFTLSQQIARPKGQQLFSKLLLSDLNNDGLIDIVSFDSQSTYVSFQDAATPGKFDLPVKISSDPKFWLISISDLNNDGINDLLGLNKSYDLTLQLQDSFNAGEFLAPVNLGFKGGATAVGDFNGDLINDIVVTNRGSNTVTLLVQDPGIANTFAPAGQYHAGTSPESIMIADLDRDGRLDVVTQFEGDFYNNIRGGIAVLLQDAANPGTFLTTVIYDNKILHPPVSAQKFAIGDLNNDGWPDIAALADPFGAPERIAILFQDATSPGAFLAPRSVIAKSYPRGLQIADMNNDLYNDLVIADEGLEIRYQKPSAPGTFSKRKLIYDPN